MLQYGIICSHKIPSNIPNKRKGDLKADTTSGQVCDPIILCFNSVAKYCNTLILQKLKVLPKVLHNAKVVQKVLQNLLLRFDW